jgi:phenylalanyl-tRNA synthetase alpha chain
VELNGKKGVLAALSARMAALSPAEKPIAGKLLNNHKGVVIRALNDRREALEAAALKAALQAEAVDVSLPGIRPRAGAIHPVQQTRDELARIFRLMGYVVETGPEVENEWFNFDALNMPDDHPARDMQDTFFVERGMVLRTHTSPVQIRTMLKRKPPFAVITPGKVYRCDADATHSPMFHQMEGLLVDRHVSMPHLKATLLEFLRAYFGPDVEMRLRPSFFPFTEPSAEVDVMFGAGESRRWLEVLGCGMVHPKVLANAGLDPKEWQGFAFGLGIDRLAMIKFGVPDIRMLYENHMRFLKQFA